MSPTVAFSAGQSRVFRNETTTQGWTTLGFDASYVVATPHVSHVLTVTSGNLANRTYRMHTAFLKDVAPEPGRGVRATYTLKFF